MPTNDYIMRSDALEEVQYIPVTMDDEIDVEAAQQLINAIPAADVEPKRKTGRWSVIEGKIRRDIDKRIVKCNLCGNYLSMEGVNCGRGDANYCPNCGAKMDAEPPKEADNGNK